MYKVVEGKNVAVHILVHKYEKCFIIDYRNKYTVKSSEYRKSTRTV